MGTNLKSVLKYISALLFNSDILNPLKILLIVIFSFLIANSKINYFSINIPLLYVSFIKHFLRAFLTISILASLPFTRTKKRIVIPVLIVLLIYTVKFSEMKSLVVMFSIASIYFVKPSGISIHTIPAFLSFILGLENSHKSWIDLDTKLFFILPCFILLFEPAKKNSSELTSWVLFFSLIFLSRPIGAINGSLFFIAQRISKLFPKTKILFSFILPFISFLFGYIYFLEFQRGIPLGEPLLFLSKIYIPAIASITYPLFVLVSFIIRKIRDSKAF